MELTEHNCHIVCRYSRDILEAELPNDHGFLNKNLFKKFKSLEQAELFLMLLNLEGDKAWTK